MCSSDKFQTVNMMMSTHFDQEGNVNVVIVGAQKSQPGAASAKNEGKAASASPAVSALRCQQCTSKSNAQHSGATHSHEHLERKYLRNKASRTARVVATLHSRNTTLLLHVQDDSGNRFEI